MDLHWADGETLSLLKHVAAGTADSALLVLGTYRESDLDRGHPLRNALADCAGWTEWSSARCEVGADEVAELVSAATGSRWMTPDTREIQR